MIITILMLISNYLFGQNSNSTHYKLLKTIENIEIREYNESMNISYYDESSENYFQKLANYIFGGNEQNQKISMTSPVTMRQYGDKEMIFRLPNNFMIDKAPNPENKQIKMVHKATVQQLIATREELRDEQNRRRKAEADLARYRGVLKIQMKGRMGNEEDMMGQ